MVVGVAVISIGILCFFIGIDTVFLLLLLLVLILYYCIGIDIVFFHWYLIMYFFIGIDTVFLVGIIANVSDGCEIRLKTNTEHPRTSLVWPQV